MPAVGPHLQPGDDVFGIRLGSDHDDQHKKELSDDGIVSGCYSTLSFH